MPPAIPPSTELTESWYCVIRRLKVWVNSPGSAPFRPYALLVVDLDSGLVLDARAFESCPTAAEVFSELTDLMGDRVPRAVLFEDSGWMAKMQPELERIAIDAGLHDDPDGTEMIVTSLETHLRGGREELPALLDQPGATLNTVGAFFSAAADCYRAAPWGEFSDADLINVWVGEQLQPACVSILGNAGIQYGFSVYWNAEQLQWMFEQDPDNHGVLPADGIHALYYEGITAVAFPDLEALEAYEWPVAGERAYPMPVIMYPGGLVMRPDADQLRWYESLLLALPQVMLHYLRTDRFGALLPFDAEMPVNTSGGFCLVRVQYPAEITVSGPPDLG